MKYEALPLFDRLVSKILSFYQTIWKDKRAEDTLYLDWLSNFKNLDDSIQDRERLNALFLLSRFMYFGNIELRELLRSMYRDLYKYPIIKAIRKANNDTLDTSFIENSFRLEASKTRFLGVGNPSESGVHLLYYFRQENALSKEFFINHIDIFTNTRHVEQLPTGKEREFWETKLTDEEINRYVFIDDFCGSGSQAKSYSKKVVELIKSINPKIEVCYLMLFGTEHGIKSIRDETEFDCVEAIFTLDESFKCFSNDSRYYQNGYLSSNIDKDFTKTFCSAYGSKLFGHALGYRDCQLLLGLFHNTPDNTLPIFWSDEENWMPIFRRYHKIY